jgi:hypothetical protein
MSGTADVDRAMVMHGHKLPGREMHFNSKTHELWRYCDNCQALGALRSDGTMYGKATTAPCPNPDGRKAPPKAHQPQMSR